MMATASIDTTCTVWDLHHSAIKTQIIAHDKEVYDIKFAEDSNIFITAGGDASIRLFDTRDLHHSFLLCENPSSDPFVRVSWNGRRTDYFAVLVASSSEAAVYDRRYAGSPVVKLLGHEKCVNSVAWANVDFGNLIVTAGEDHQALIWDIDRNRVCEMETNAVEPALTYEDRDGILMVQWPIPYSEWICISLRDKVRLLKV